MLLANGKLIASAPVPSRLRVAIKPKQATATPPLANYAVNNENGKYYPHINASFPGTGASYASKLNDGQYWYLNTTPNQWATMHNSDRSHWAEVDFGTSRTIKMVKLYFVEDSATGIKLPTSYNLQYWSNNTWVPVPLQKRTYNSPKANSANSISFPDIAITKMRLQLSTAAKSPIAISEIETWGDPVAHFLVPANPTVANNLAHQSVAKFSASYQSRFDRPNAINDGLADPNRRWTSFESPNTSDWVQFDLKEITSVSKVYLYVYNDNGGVKPPKSYQVQYWDGTQWTDVLMPVKLPETPIAHLNICSFAKVKTDKIRITTEHFSTKSFSGLYEVEIH